MDESRKDLGQSPDPGETDLEGSISTTDGTPAPTLETLSLQFDKSGVIFTKGLATCSIGLLDAEENKTTVTACRQAVVGHGSVIIGLHFREQGLEATVAPLEIFNGPPRGGHPVLIYRIHIQVPAAATSITSGSILGKTGKFGTLTTLRIPTIAQGHGAVARFHVQLGRSWTYKGKKVSLLTASCPKGSLAAHGEFDFVGGEKASGEVEQKCS